MQKIILFLLINFSVHALDIGKHLKSFSYRAPLHQLEGVDSIYVINLDSRPKKFSQVTQEFSRYHLVTQRFSAVYGWSLTDKDLSDIGLEYEPSMLGDLAQIIPSFGKTRYLTERDLGKACFHPTIKKGAIGCTLSHLSILKEAYEADREIIWICEDDVAIEKNPQELKKIMQELTDLVGDGGWDILFTDDLRFFTHSGLSRPDLFQIYQDYLFTHKKELEQTQKKLAMISKKTPREKLEYIELKKILNYPNKDQFFLQYPDVFENFRKITGRFATHSMIIKKSGIRKILDFVYKRGIFTSYDNELSLILGLKMFNLKKNMTSMREGVSDTAFQGV